ncbi:hypothetical protein [Aureibacter tunicatorum]|uniref:Uncharacterized protein n=1 Tax=Aureibacter tunicatorum TaxID=866807 RepID=A0AAE3XTA9_9BACT|nr:hypothetical protein [Aureibacter tunicatorum]MDR6241620.1 hypothetical protein [Aureibacter tunicatorum]
MLDLAIHVSMFRFAVLKCSPSFKLELGRNAFGIESTANPSGASL